MALETDGNSITIPFDTVGAGRYEFEVYPEHIESGDAVVLALDREACRSFAAIFSQLAEGRFPEGYHVHLGWDEGAPSGPGLRIVLTEKGRLAR